MKVIFDITNVIPGKNDTSGIWVYASRLLSELDEMAATQDIEIICLKNSLNSNIRFSNIILIDCDVKYDNVFQRIHWVHIRLPKLCKRYRADLLHRLVPDMPIFNYSKSVRTLQDLMFNFYLNNKNYAQSDQFESEAKFQILNANSRYRPVNLHTMLDPSENLPSDPSLSKNDSSNKFSLILKEDKSFMNS